MSRLIDADELLTAFPCGETVRTECVRATIGHMPTIEERKTGKWIKNEEESAKHVEAIYVCSACHNFEAWGDTEKHKFCPNCGAEMGGGHAE